MSRTVFINFPVSNVAASTAFYEAIGLTKNPQFSDQNASCMVLSEAVSFMLLSHEHWGQFTAKQIPDAHTTAEVMVAISVDSREDVDKLVEAAVAAGGSLDARPDQELPFMYNRAINDPDGHILELAWFNPAGMA